MASGGAGRTQLLEYIGSTLARVEARQDVEPAELRGKILPSVTSSINRLTAAAPPQVRNRIKDIFTQYGVLPDHKGTVDGLKSALADIRSVIEGGGAPPSAPEDATPAKTPAEPEESHEAEADEADEAQDEVEEQAEAEAEAEEEEAEVEDEVADKTAEEANVEVAASPVAEQTSASAAAAGGAGRAQLLEYIGCTVSRIQSKEMSDSEFQTKVMPSVVASIQRLTASAPAKVKDAIQGIFTDAQVLPDYMAAIGQFLESLDKVRGLIQGPSVPATTADAAPVPAPGDTVAEAEAAAPPKDPNSSLGHRLRGLSVEFMATDLIAEVYERGLTRDSKVYELEPALIRPRGADVVCPRDNRLGAAYVDCLSEYDAGMSSFMLSYTWGYTIGDIVDSLTNFCENRKMDKRKSNVWICCLCINQHRVKEAQARKEVVPFEKFKDEFGDRVKSIGHVVALMSPWREPVYLKRVWCDFEMFTAAALKDECEISISMPPKESQDMRATLMSGTSANNTDLWESLQKVKIENADASVEEDKIRIFKLIETSIGFHALDTTVTDCIQKWVGSTCEDILAEVDEKMPSAEEIAKAKAGVSYVLRDIHKTERAYEVMTEAVKWFEAAKLIDTFAGAILLSNYGATCRRVNDLPKALQVFVRAKSIFEKTNSMDSLEGALFFNSYGAACRQNKDLQNCFEAFETARGILEKIDKFQTSEGAMVMNSLGAARRQVGDIAGALAAFDTAHEILTNGNMLLTPSGHVLMNSIAAVKKQTGDTKGALEAYLDGQKAIQKMGMVETPGGAQLMAQIGQVKKKLRDIPGAIAAYTEAKRIHNVLKTPHGDALNEVDSMLRQLQGGGGKGGNTGKGAGNPRHQNSGANWQTDGGWQGGGWSGGGGGGGWNASGGGWSASGGGGGGWNSRGGASAGGGGGGGGGGGDATSSGSSSRQETERERKQELDCMDVHERDHRNEAFQLLSRIFDVVDRDGSRVINETELVESLSDPTTGDVVQNEILSGLMKMATSKDGKISKKNFVNMFTHGFPTYNRVEFEAAVAMLRRLLAHLRAARKASQVEADKRRHKGAPYQERRLVRTPRSQTPRRAKEGPETTSSRPSSASEAKTPYGEKQRTPTAVAVREADGTSRVQRQQAEAPRSTNRPRSQPSTGETARTIARSRPRRGRSPKSEKTKEEEAEEVKESEEPIQPLAFDDPWAAAAARLENGQARPLAFQCASATFEADWAMNQPLSPSGPQSGLRGNHNLIPEEDPEIDLFANVPISADGQKVEFTPTTVVAARSSYKDVFDRVARCEPLSEVASKGLARSPRTAAGGLTPRTIAGNCRTAFLQVVESPEVSRSTPEGIYIHKWRHDRLLFE
eukprot:TRINITY_DN11704_c0_g1_i2.p1 TRINITY_DN11704_c0_g1~~TRINITY_DN11704_c0_g1_i2.p1  ORF type:complete len:1360 (+),score=300.08 TRINITY_DN11704_c0_g1_i2:78-4157(+)